MAATSNQGQQPGNQQQTSHQGGGILSQDKKDHIDPAKIEEIGTQLKSLTTRLRTLEEKYRNLRAGIQTSEKNSLDESKRISTEISDVNHQVYELKKNFKDTNEKMDIIIKELGLTAKKEEVETIQKYLDLWNPVNFVSQEEIVPVVKRALTDLGIKSKHDLEKIEEVETGDRKRTRDEGF